MAHIRFRGLINDVPNAGIPRVLCHTWFNVIYTNLFVRQIVLNIIISQVSVSAIARILRKMNLQPSICFIKPLLQCVESPDHPCAQRKPCKLQRAPKRYGKSGTPMVNASASIKLRHGRRERSFWINVIK